MTDFIEFLICLAIAFALAALFYWYGRKDGLAEGKGYSDTRYETGKRDGYAEGYAEAAGKSYDAGYRDGWAYR